MAKVVFGAATSRSPLMAAPAEMWPAIGERDKQSRRLRDRAGRLITYEELLAKAPPSMAQQVTPAVFQAKCDASRRAFATVTQKLAAAKPDVILFMGDDEEEYIHDDNRPAIMLYRGQTWRNIPRAANASDPIAAATNWQWGREERDYPIAADLTTHVLRYLIESEFDVADSLTLKAMAHGFGFLYERMYTERIVPIVPVIVNVHTPPAQPTPKRCYELGRALRGAIEAWDEDLRVAVVGSGGLSVGVLEEEFDRAALDAMQRRDVAAISKLPRPWIQGSTGEVLCWVCTAGAAEHLKMQVVDYIPAYRSPAGTGTGLAFAVWE
jgi:hypothetical protein